MSYKTILVHCDAAPKVGQRLTVAAELAERFEAHLVGVHACPPLEAPIFFEGGVAMDALFASYEASAEADQAAARQAFEKAAKQRRIPSSEWRVTDGFIDSELVVQARYTDLLVLGQTDPDAQTPTPSDLPEAVVLASGRPTLVVPHIGVTAPIGESVLLCWNASRESARAAADAMPFLRHAQKVVVLVVDPRTSPNGHGAEPGADVAHWLTRHGVNVTVQRDVAADSDVGTVILSRAADIGSDLIVMGVYGHSRMREMVLGGVSRTLLSSMTVPVLISH
jgi:nucleotide-binding universal stress UspA family protein